jgi:riboflavin kinase/FMN adenylyltransferase
LKIFKNLNEIVSIPSPVLTIGTFDGVHIGHQRIINQLNEVAQLKNGESVLFTFYPHPRMIIFPDNHGLKLIQTQEEKLQKLNRMGLQNVIVYPFTKEFSRLTGTQFVRDFLVNKLNVKTIVIGYDHQFGRNREGTLKLLHELSPVYGFDVIEIEAQDIDDVNVSSTKIRTAIAEGDIQTANSYLGEPFQINGKIIKGQQIGRKIGFPTANLSIDNDLKLLPKNGAYVVRCTMENGGVYYGMLNIGVRPTISNHEGLSIEVHLLDFEGDLYGQHLQVELLDFLREEKKFSTLEELTIQLTADEQLVRHFIEHSI